MTRCKMWYCTRSSDLHKDIQFFRFPTKPAVRAEWIRRCVKREEDIPLFVIKDSWRVCSDHFPKGKKNADKSINMPVVAPPAEVETETETETKPKIVENLPVDKNHPDEYCRICLRIVATSILHKITSELKRRLRGVFELDFAVNSPGVFICSNCINVMDICLSFHRAVRNAHKLQSQTEQTIRLECDKFWNHSEHVESIAKCKCIVKNHSKAIRALFNTNLDQPSAQTRELPETSNVETSIVLDTTIGAAPEVQPESQVTVFKTEEMSIDPEELIIEQEELIIESAEITVEPSTLKCEPDIPPDDEDYSWFNNDIYDRDYFDYRPPANNVVSIRKRNNGPSEQKKRRILQPSEHKIAYFQRHKLPVPVYREALCDICGKHSNANQAEAHKNKHLGVKPYKCDFEGCTATFYGRHNKTIHLRRFHINPRIRDCEVCGNKIRGDNWAYKEHVRTHSEQRDRFECEHCNQCYSAEVGLKRHLRTAHGVKTSTIVYGMLDDTKGLQIEKQTRSVRNEPDGN